MKLFVKLFAVLVIIAVVAGHFYLGHYLREAIYSGPTEEAIDLNAPILFLPQQKACCTNLICILPGTHDGPPRRLWAGIRGLQPRQLA